MAFASRITPNFLHLTDETGYFVSVAVSHVVSLEGLEDAFIVVLDNGTQFVIDDPEDQLVLSEVRETI